MPKKFASLVEIENQHVLSSNTEKNARQLLSLSHEKKNQINLFFLSTLSRFDSVSLFGDLKLKPFFDFIFESLLFWRSGPHSALGFSDLSLSLGFCRWFENLVAFWRQNFNYFVREFLSFYGSSDSARDHPQIMSREKTCRDFPMKSGRFVDSGAHHSNAN
jgi:hypothetical protein